MLEESQPLVDGKMRALFIPVQDNELGGKQGSEGAMADRRSTSRWSCLLPRYSSAMANKLHWASVAIALSMIVSVVVLQSSISDHSTALAVNFISLSLTLLAMSIVILNLAVQCLQSNP